MSEQNAEAVTLIAPLLWYIWNDERAFEGLGIRRLRLLYWRLNGETLIDELNGWPTLGKPKGDIIVLKDEKFGEGHFKTVVYEKYVRRTWVPAPGYSSSSEELWLIGEGDE